VRNPTKPLTFHGTVEHTTLTASGQLASIGPLQLPILAKVLAEGENEPAIVMPCHAAQSVVRVLGQRFERGNGLFGIATTISIAIFNSQDPIALR
jgi:hypothetical protein